MQVIDLLNKMRLFDDYRPNVKFKDRVYLYDKCLGNYGCGDYYGLFSGYCIDLILDDEIELIEEKKIELPENIEIPKIEHKDNQRILNAEIKINSLIDYLKYKEEESKK